MMSDRNSPLDKPSVHGELDAIRDNLSDMATKLARLRDAAQTLGLMNLANSLPQVAAPSLGILIFYLGGQAGLSWTFLVAAGFAVVGGAVISFVRGVG